LTVEGDTAGDKGGYVQMEEDIIDW
jgi:hypothetical protein